MGVRTVRLDEETERVLADIVKTAKIGVSTALKRGLLALKDELARRPARLPIEIYESLNLGPGGYAIAPSTETRRGVREALRRKHRR